MKFVITSLMLITLISSCASAQRTLRPAKNLFDKKWIKEETSKMTWYGMRDTMKIEIGEVTTDTKIDKKNFIVITSVSMKNAKVPWVDSAVAIRKTMAPVRHTSSNMQRDIVLNFGKVVTGNYLDKTKNIAQSVRDTTYAAYFDSNLYPVLIRWLPLGEGYVTDIAIYDYNITGKQDVIKASIEKVTSGTYQSSKEGLRDVWVVTAKDEIGSDDKAFNIYYIDKITRQLWRQEMSAGGRKMMMIRQEL